MKFAAEDKLFSITHIIFSLFISGYHCVLLTEDLYTVYKDQDLDTAIERNAPVATPSSSLFQCTVLCSSTSGCVATVWQHGAGGTCQLVEEDQVTTPLNNHLVMSTTSSLAVLRGE